MLIPHTQVGVTRFIGMAICAGLFAGHLHSQQIAPVGTASPIGPVGTPSQVRPVGTPSSSPPARTDRLPKSQDNDYRVGGGDLLDIAVLEASEFNRSLRVTASGEISMPPLGTVKVGGLVPQEIESVITTLLRQSVMNDPHVTVFVHEIESHPVSVTGAVKKPGGFNICGPKGALAIISMAEGLADDAGTTALVIHGGNYPFVTSRAVAEDGTVLAEPSAPGVAFPNAASIEVELKDLLNSSDPRFNVQVYPGDVVKVSRAGIVYVLGDVKKPGGYLLRNSENVTVLQALALAEGLMITSAKKQARIIRTDGASGQRTEIPLDLEKLLQGKSADAAL